MRRSRLTLVPLAWLILPGCATIWDVATGVNPGVTGHSDLLGNASQRFIVPLERLRRATIEVLTDMNVGGVIEKKQPDGILFCGKMYDYRGILVKLRPEGNCVTMAVWIGTSGDEALAKVFIDRTSVRLATQPRYPILPGTENDPTANPNFARDAAPDSITQFGQDVAGYRGMPLR